MTSGLPDGRVAVELWSMVSRKMTVSQCVWVRVETERTCARLCHLPRSGRPAQRTRRSKKAQPEPVPARHCRPIAPDAGPHGGQRRLPRRTLSPLEGDGSLRIGEFLNGRGSGMGPDRKTSTIIKARPLRAGPVHSSAPDVFFVYRITACQRFHASIEASFGFWSIDLGQ